MVILSFITPKGSHSINSRPMYIDGLQMTLLCNIFVKTLLFLAQGSNNGTHVLILLGAQAVIS